MFTYAGERVLALRPYPQTRCLCGECDDLFSGVAILTESGRALGVPFAWLEKHPDPPGWPEEFARLKGAMPRRERPVKPGRLPGQDGTRFLLDPVTEAFAVLANARAEEVAA